MNLVNASVMVRGLESRNLTLVEEFGRLCWKSDEVREAKLRNILENPDFEKDQSYDIRLRKANKKITDDFVKFLVKKGHLSVLEHEIVSVKWVTDRATANQLVRHRIGSYSQESLRYVKGCGEFVIPHEFSKDLGPGEYNTETLKGMKTDKYWFWIDALLTAQKSYETLLDMGCKKEEARSVLPLATKTVIASTFNLSQWRHVFKERLAPQAQQDIRRLCALILEQFLHSNLRAAFEDLEPLLANKPE